MSRYNLNNTDAHGRRLDSNTIHSPNSNVRGIDPRGPGAAQDIRRHVARIRRELLREGGARAGRTGACRMEYLRVSRKKHAGRVDGERETR